MAPDSADESELRSQGFEPVLVEIDRYDGPRSGLAEIGGVVHYFDSRDGRHIEEAEFQVWPAGAESTRLEVEHWQIFVAFDTRREAGGVGDESHPGHGGIDARYDELSELVKPRRVPPPDALRMRATWHWLDRDWYIPVGPPYMALWRLLEEE